MYRTEKNYEFIFIYVIRNILNEKEYIGFHATNDLNDDYYGSGKLIERAIKKYGKKNFAKEIVEFCNEENWEEREIYWIKEKNTYYPNGYNLTHGGEGGFGKIMNEEARKKISDSKKGKPAWNKGKKGIYSEKSLLKMSISQSGKIISEETRKKISEANTGRPKTEEELKKLSIAKLGDKNPAKRKDVKEKISAKLKGMFRGDKNPMYGSNRTKDELEELKSQGVELKGDQYEYMRKKIKCENIITGEIKIFDGV
jgi:group I intron endonuclease